MAIHFDKNYEGVFYSQPKDDISPKRKNKVWHAEWCKYIYSFYLNNRCGFKYSDRNHDEILRSYSEGRQSSEIYKDWLLGEIEEGETERKGFVGINFDDVFSPAPKYMSVILSLLNAVEHDIVVDAIDEKAGVEKQNQQETLWFKKMFKPFLDKLQQSGQEEEYLPETRKELELFASMGGFKLRREVALEKGLSHTENISDWKEISNKIKTDFIVLNKAAVMDEVDVYTQKVKSKYINVSDLIIEYSHSDDFKKSRYGGIPVEYNISDLRTMFNKEDEKLTEDDLKSIANAWSGRLGNPTSKDFSTHDVCNDNGTYGYDSYKVQCLNCAWKSTNSVYKKKNGYLINGEKVKKNELKNGKVEKIDLRVIYNAKWIIGTDYVFNYGLMNDIPRPEKNEVNLPFHVYMLKGKSIIENIKSTLDQIQLNYLKLQSALANAPPNGIQVEIGALENVSIGEKKMKPLDLITLRRQTGDILYRATTHHGQMGYGNAPPIKDTIGGIGPLLGEIMQIFEMSFNHIAELTGIDRITTASKSPTTSMPVGTQVMAYQNTNTVLKPIYNAYISVKESKARNESLRIQLICVHNKDKEKGYEKIIGKASVEALRVSGSLPSSVFGLKIVARPTDEIKKDIKMAAIEAMKVGKNGQPGITMGEYLFLMKQLESGSSVDYARAYITYREQKNTEKDIMIGQQNMKQQNDGLLQQNEQKHNQAKDLITHETNEEIRKMKEEAMLESGKMNDEHIYNKDTELLKKENSEAV